MVSHRPRENILALSGRHKLQLSMARSMIASILQFFSGAVSYTGFRTGYNSRHHGENEVNCGSSHKLQMKSYNLCSPWIITFEGNIYESVKNGCTEQHYQTFASESEQLCKKKARRRKQNQQVERFFNFIWRNITSKRFIRRRRSVLNLCYVAFPEDDITWCIHVTLLTERWFRSYR